MPRLKAPRQRIVQCDCLDCVDPSSVPLTNLTLSAANEAAARQEPPPKCLLVHVSGFVRVQESSHGRLVNSLAECEVKHLDRVARDGNQGLLLLRKGSRSDRGHSDQGLMELVQLLGVYSTLFSGQGDIDEVPLPSLQERFKGMQGSLWSNMKEARDLGVRVGMTCKELGAPIGLGKETPGSDPWSALPPPALTAREVLEELGLQEAEAGIDILFLHLDLPTLAKQPWGDAHEDQDQDKDHGAAAVATAAAATTAAAADDDDGDNVDQQEGNSPSHLWDTSLAGLQWLDQLIRYCNESTLFKETVLLTLVLSSQGVSLSQEPLLQPGGPLLHPGMKVGGGSGWLAEGEPCPPVMRPTQSFQKLGEEVVDVDLTSPMLVVRRLPGVIRKDKCAVLGYEECLRNSGMLGMLADRLLPELAYKLGRAPKYGA